MTFGTTIISTVPCAVCWSSPNSIPRIGIAMTPPPTPNSPPAPPQAAPSAAWRAARARAASAPRAAPRLVVNHGRVVQGHAAVRQVDPAPLGETAVAAVAAGIPQHPRTGSEALAAPSRTTCSAAAAVTAATAATPTILSWLGLVDRQVAAAVVSAVEPVDRRLGLGVRAHLNEGESLRTVRVPVNDDLRTLHCAELGEQGLQVGLVDVVGQVAHV